MATEPFWQSRCFSDVVDLYKPEQTTNVAGLTDQKYPSTPTYSNVRCHIEPNPEASQPRIIGRSGVDQIDTTDIIHVAYDQEIGAMWAVQLKTLGHPERLQWWLTQGDAKTLSWRGKKRSAYMKRSLKPPGAA